MASKIPSETVELIKTLRLQGFSLPEIQSHVGIGYGTIFRYVKEIDILPQYKQIWKAKKRGSIKRMIIAKEQAYQKAVKQIHSITDNERLIIFTCLYWAEGSKGDFSFTNTDPEMIRLFVNLIRSLGVTDDRFKMTLRIYEDLDRQKCIKYWSKITNLEVSNLNIMNGKKKGKLKYGMCRIRITKGGDMLKYIFALKDQIVKLNFSRPYSSTDRTRVS